MPKQQHHIPILNGDFLNGLVTEHLASAHRQAGETSKECSKRLREELATRLRTLLSLCAECGLQLPLSDEGLCVLCSTKSLDKEQRTEEYYGG